MAVCRDFVDSCLLSRRGVGKLSIRCRARITCGLGFCYPSITSLPRSTRRGPELRRRLRQIMASALPPPEHHHHLDLLTPLEQEILDEYYQLLVNLHNVKSTQRLLLELGAKTYLARSPPESTDSRISLLAILWIVYAPSSEKPDLCLHSLRLPSTKWS